MSCNTASLDELLCPRVLSVQDLDPAVLLTGITFARTFFATLTPEELDQVRRRARRDHPVERALLHLLRIDEIVRQGEVTWNEVETRLIEIVERQETN